jgi:hypothetical protein
MIRLITAALAAAALATAPALAQQQDDVAAGGLDQAKAACAGGAIGILRISKIKPEGTMEGFLAAAAANQAWYREHGYKDNEQIVLRELATRGQGLRNDEVITLHVNPPASTSGQDAAYRAFVEQYRKNSEIETQSYVCLGRLGIVKPAGEGAATPQAGQ